jgi:predicted  nucleic acid-binding Zn-ribbon protein
VDDRAVGDLRGLARLDEELAEAAARLRELDKQAGELRARAEAIDAFFAAYPEEDTRRREAVAAARAEVERREHERAEAAQRLAEARDDEARAAAERAVARADDHLDIARATLTRSEHEHAQLERDAARLPDEVPELEERAHVVASAVPEVPEPEGGPRALVEWASRAHAELFVGARQIDAQRERVIREANELASMVLGEPTYGSTPAQALARVEHRTTAED